MIKIHPVDGFNAKVIYDSKIHISLTTNCGQKSMRGGHKVMFEFV